MASTLSYQDFNSKNNSRTMKNFNEYNGAPCHTSQSSADVVRNTIPLYNVENDDYHDYASIDIDTIRSIVDPPKAKRKGPRGGVVLPFPVRLYNMLEGVEKEGLSHIVSWQPHGRCFLLHQQKAFVDDIMPRYFKQSKLTSFQRQLNLYGFKKVSSGADRGAYYHELFLRNRPDIAKIMFRTRIDVASYPDTKPSRFGVKETNFYELRSCSKETPTTTCSQAVHTSCASNDSVSNACFKGQSQRTCDNPFTIESDDNTWSWWRSEPAYSDDKKRQIDNISSSLDSRTVSDSDFNLALNSLLDNENPYPGPMHDTVDFEPTLWSAPCTEATDELMASAASLFSSNNYMDDRNFPARHMHQTNSMRAVPDSSFSSSQPLQKKYRSCTFHPIEQQSSSVKNLSLVQTMDAIVNQKSQARQHLDSTVEPNQPNDDLYDYTRESKIQNQSIDTGFFAGNAFKCMDDAHLAAYESILME